jgi:cell wall assembly regulator SMI1
MYPVEIGGRLTPLVLQTVGPRVSENTIAAFEATLGHKLPPDYREFLLRYNGGIPVVGDVLGRDDRPDVPYQHGDSFRSFLKLPTPEVEVPLYERLQAIIDEDWPLPKSWLPIADDAGGNFFALDLGSDGKLIRFINHESLEEDISNHRVIAEGFLDLLLRVVSVEENAARERAAKSRDRKRLENGPFPSRLSAQLRIVSRFHPEVSSWCRALSLKLFDSKGHFSVHDDELSRLMLDLMFWVNERAHGDGQPTPRTELAKIVYDWWSEAEDAFGLTGYCREYVDEWWKDRLASGALVGDYTAARFGTEASADFLKRLHVEILR